MQLASHLFGGWINWDGPQSQNCAKTPQKLSKLTGTSFLWNSAMAHVWDLWPMTSARDSEVTHGTHLDSPRSQWDPFDQTPLDPPGPVKALWSPICDSMFFVSYKIVHGPSWRNIASLVWSIEINKLELIIFNPLHFVSSCLLSFLSSIQAGPDSNSTSIQIASVRYTPTHKETKRGKFSEDLLRQKISPGICTLFAKKMLTYHIKKTQEQVLYLPFINYVTYG